MSDLHGNADAYHLMLKKINFQKDDMLYILGDILDRGPNPIKIIMDLMQRANVEVIAGNHCVMACECIPLLLKEVTDDSIAELNEEKLMKIFDWQQNGGTTTIEELRKCEEQLRRDILSFISEFELYDEIEVGGKQFVLVHAGLRNFSPEKELWEYELDELVWERPNYSKAYFKDKYVITGHTPTMSIRENPHPGYIYQANNHIAIDCGCCFPGGRLGCLRLDDMKEFYVETEEVNE